MPNTVPGELDVVLEWRGLMVVTSANVDAFGDSQLLALERYAWKAFPLRRRISK